MNSRSMADVLISHGINPELSYALGGLSSASGVYQSGDGIDVRTIIDFDLSVHDLHSTLQSLSGVFYKDDDTYFHGNTNMYVVSGSNPEESELVLQTS